MARDKNKYDKSYDEGYNEGKNDDILGNVIHNQVKDIRYPFDERERRSYNAGYEDGAMDREEGGSSNYSGGSGNESDSSCFVTTATLKSIGKPDDCEELNTFRNFRDNWVVIQDDGQELISEYYLVAPQIVKKIDTNIDSENVYLKLWSEHIEPCLNLLKQGKFFDAKQVYIDTMFMLKAKYLNN
jgi:hypothetical protein